MNSSVGPIGNDPQRFGALLQLLDDKMQLGLLGPLERVKSYHFEGSMLFIEPGSPADAEYLAKEAVQKQLAVLAGDACKVEGIALHRAQSES